MERPPLTTPLVDRELVAGLFRRADAARWHISAEVFGEWVNRSAAHRFGASRPSTRDLRAYIDALHAADLALACACAAGDDTAWEYFIQEYRPKLYAAAGAIGGRDPRDLADSLYADLFGMSSRDGVRRSLFEYFHGRSSLLTWLRAVMARRHVDAIRAGRKTDVLDEESMAVVDGSATPPDPDRGRFLKLLQDALTTALERLEPRDRLRLASYYVQDLTLAQIGRLSGEHEATVSRKLERTRRLIRQSVERHLREDAHLTDSQVQLCLEYAAEEWPLDVTGLLSEPGT